MTVRNRQFSDAWRKKIRNFDYLWGTKYLAWLLWDIKLYFHSSTFMKKSLLHILYLLVRYVPFIAKGARFLLQCTKCSRPAPLYNGEKHFVHCRRILHWSIWQHNKPTDLSIRLNTLCTHMSGSNLWNLNGLLPLICFNSFNF